MRDEFGNFKEGIIAFVVDVEREYITDVQDAVRKIIKEYADKAYVYAPGLDEVPLNKGMVIGAFLNRPDEVYNLGKAVQHTIAVVNKESNEDKKLFVITSRANKSSVYACFKAVSSDKDKEIDIYFVCLGDVFDRFKPNVDVILEAIEGQVFNSIIKFIDPDYEIIEVEEEVVENAQVVEVPKASKPKAPTVKPAMVDLGDVFGESVS